MSFNPYKAPTSGPAEPQHKVGWYISLPLYVGILLCALFAALSNVILYDHVMRPLMPGETMLDLFGLETLLEAIGTFGVIIAFWAKSRFFAVICFFADLAMVCVRDIPSPSEQIRSDMISLSLVGITVVATFVLRRGNQYRSAG